MSQSKEAATSAFGHFLTQSGTFRRNANLTVAKLAHAMPHSRD
jgi:hypothetical protein